MKQDSRIFVAGHNGMVGRSIVRRLISLGFTHVICASRGDLDLREQAAVQRCFQETHPEVVFMAAAKVGGIKANMEFPAEFLYDNLMIEANILGAAIAAGTELVVAIGSSCMYPRECPQPMKEEYLLTGPLEPTNEGYAVAKIAGTKLAQYMSRQGSFRALCPVPCNLYGPDNSFDPLYSHVLAALVKKFVEAKRKKSEVVTLWGTGTARREFLHVEDLVDALLLLIDRFPSEEMINVGPGVDVSIRELAELIASEAGFKGAIEWDDSMPDGMPQKLMDVSKIESLGWRPNIALNAGIRELIKAFNCGRGSSVV